MELTEISGKPLKDASELSTKGCRSRPWWLQLCFGSFSLDFQKSSAAGTKRMPGLFNSFWLGMDAMSWGRVRGWRGAAFPRWPLWAMHMGQSHTFPKGLDPGCKCSWRWSLCVCCPTVLDFWVAIVILENNSCFLVNPNQINLISLDQSVSYRLLLEHRQPHRKEYQWTQQGRQLLHPPF